MKRGDIVLFRMINSPASKARPCVVVQRSVTIAASTKLTVCPITSSGAGQDSMRPLLAPTAENGLKRPSEVEVDWTYTFPIECLGGVVGSLDDDSMMRIDIALRRWLDL